MKRHKFNVKSKRTTQKKTKCSHNMHLSECTLILAPFAICTIFYFYELVNDYVSLPVLLPPPLLPAQHTSNWQTPHTFLPSIFRVLACPPPLPPPPTPCPSSPPRPSPYLSIYHHRSWTSSHSRGAVLCSPGVLFF